jgi:hypothetical protein
MWVESGMRILGGIALGIAVGALFMFIAHLVEGINSLDFWGIARAVGTIGAIVGAVVGLVWELASHLKRTPAANPPGSCCPMCGALCATPGRCLACGESFSSVKPSNPSGA